MPDGERGAAVGPTDSELRAGLEVALARRVLEMTRRPSAYRTSFPLEELDLTLEDGEEPKLIFKDLAWARLEPAARLAKPGFLHDPRREPSVYAEVLTPHGLGPRHHGSTIDTARGRHWLFVERVEGQELYQLGDLTPWRATAAWLAEMHARLAEDLERHLTRGRLLDYDASYYRRWMARACGFAEAGDATRRSALDRVAKGYDTVVEGLLDQPRTVLHGELYASNVLVDVEASAPRVCPVDWETAAAGPGLVDLAALISGGWGEMERESIVDAYRAVAGEDAFSADDLRRARLHLAVQWLGWAPPEWIPPQGQRHDWLAEAVALTEELAFR